MSKCLSLLECKELAKRGKYVNFSTKILEIATRDLSGTAFKLWQFLSAESVFDSDWSVKLSNRYLAVYLHRSIRTVTRLVDELSEKHYLQCEYYSGQMTKFLVRLPVSLREELRAIKRRRMAQTLDINVGSRERCSYYLYNINNNNAAEEQKSTSPTCAVDSLPAVVTDHNAEINRLEQEKAQFEKKFNDACLSTIKNREESIIAYEIQRQIGEKIANIDLKISRLKPKPPTKPSVFKSAGAQIICDFDKIRLKNSLNHFADADKLIKEVTFSVQRGDLGHGNSLRGINSALKLIKENRWQTPLGMRQ